MEAVAREVGPVDVFVGWSMGGYTGGEAVRKGEREKPRQAVANPTDQEKRRESASLLLFGWMLRF